MKFELVDCENTILREIALKESRRRDIAKTYRLIMESSECRKVDWAKVNGAIIERWSMASLKWIKEQAHSGKCFVLTAGD